MEKKSYTAQFLRLNPAAGHPRPTDQQAAVAGQDLADILSAFRLVSLEFCVSERLCAARKHDGSELSEEIRQILIRVLLIWAENHHLDAVAIDRADSAPVVVPDGVKPEAVVVHGPEAVLH